MKSKIISQNYKIIVTDKIISNILIDDTKIYFYTKNFFYISNKNTGTIIHKISVKNVLNFSQTFLHVYLQKDKEIIQISKETGNIKNKNVFTDSIDKLFTQSFFMNGLSIEVNNTDLCNFNHTLGICNGNRQNGVKYFTNESDIEIFVFSHASVSSQTAGIILNINGVNVSHSELRPLGIAENTYTQITAIIPKGNNYTVYFNDFHHYEWREYIISSKNNVTLTIFDDLIFLNVSIDILKVNAISKNDTNDNYLSFINLLSPFKSISGNQYSQMSLESGNGFNMFTENLDTETSSLISGTPNSLVFGITNAVSNFWTMSDDNTRLDIGVLSYVFDQTGLNLGNSTLKDTTGIQIRSPNGEPHCIQVTDLNVLTTIDGECT